MTTIRCEVVPSQRHTWDDFRRFDEGNPQIWRLFVKFTLNRMMRGFVHYSARDIVHRIRWETGVWENSDTGLKINDHWSPYYARKFHGRYPQFDGYFRMRDSRADQDDDPL